MYHYDVPTQHLKQDVNQHPVDRILTAYFNTNKQIRNSSLTPRLNSYKSDTSHIIPRQRLLRSFLNKSDETEVGKTYCEICCENKSFVFIDSYISFRS